MTTTTDEILKNATLAARIDELNKAADVIFDRYMPLCTCGRGDCGATATADTVRRIVKAIIARADALADGSED